MAMLVFAIDSRIYFMYVGILMHNGTCRGYQLLLCGFMRIANYLLNPNSRRKANKTKRYIFGISVAFE